MRMRFINGGERKRLMVRGPVSDDTLKIWDSMVKMGYEPVGLVRFILHIAFPPSKRWNKDDATVD